MWYETNMQGWQNKSVIGATKQSKHKPEVPFHLQHQISACRTFGWWQDYDLIAMVITCIATVATVPMHCNDDNDLNRARIMKMTMTIVMTICMLIMIMMVPTRTSRDVDRFLHMIIVVLSCLPVTFLLIL